MAAHILHLAKPITIFSNGSGDTTYDYVKVLCFFLIALAATAVWTVLDRRRQNYTELNQWFRFYVRLTLGATLLSYGGYKVIPSQFPPLRQYQYLEMYGDASPMGILWTFMSASKSYTIFAGSVEMLGGILLFIPRLTTLGALVGMGAMANVFFLNMSYDVPVKLYSFHLLLLSALLVLPDIKRLTRFFVFNRTVEPAPAELQFQRKRLRTAFVLFQLIFGIYLGGYALYTSRQQLKSLTVDFVAQPPLAGTWGIDEFTGDGPTPISDDVRWQKVVFEFKSAITVQQPNGKLLHISAKTDTDHKTIELTKRADAKWKASLSYTFPATGNMVMDGQIGGQKVHIKLHQLDGKYLLNTRGFHWINELPFNR